MSLRWNKQKTGRLSRFMSELQQSPKSGGIMVVETGFPTSLIHLFVKNRDRLKKSSSRTKRILRQIETAPNASSPAITDAILEKPVRSKIENAHFVNGGLTAEHNKHTSDKNVCGAFVLMAFKVFIVAVLALSTKKKLTMGITLSALALLLTEIITARVLTRFNPCNGVAEKEKSGVSVHDKNVSEKIETCDDSTEPMKTEPIAVTEDSNSKVLRIRDLLLKDDKATSKSSKLKSKILKKLRSYKKNKTMKIKEETLTDVSSLVSEDNSEIIKSERDDEVKSSPPLMESRGDNMNGIVVIVLVLTGLLSGKVVAIGLTLSCLYLGFGAAKKSGLCI
ncbi:unnamed protein product [Brassica oleracea var. botrytis]|uniref:Uncharacterized protein n=2 Tax=Brassica oleracea TaxID=3712 RepID=A0A0D3E6G3_BRAOL|nr:PREDICTED: uncharacterized protein LOC106316024 [Brassica oleracea var. oleracea]VDD30247.1 unnamed protein product [Brassica oleracea]